MVNSFNFTKSSILSLPVPEKGMAVYHDTKQKGLRLYITSAGAVSFFIRKRVKGRDERIVLGSFPFTTVEQARNLALVKTGQIADGANPNLEKKKIQQEITFGELYEKYLNDYAKIIKRSWRYDEREVNKYLKHWFKRQISTIAKDEIITLHRKIGRENGIYQANRIVERIRAIFNKGIYWGWEGINPASKITQFKEKSRDRFIQPNEMPFFFDALEKEENQTIKDYIWISLLTGARKSNVLAMRWDQISWEIKQWRIPESKNDEILVLPLIERSLEILKERRRNTNSNWVFPSPESATGYLADPKRAWNRIRLDATIAILRTVDELQPLIKEVDKQHKKYMGQKKWLKLLQAKAKEERVQLPLGLTDVRIHDLRRTLGSFQAITGASLQVIGKSLGHKSQAATQIYARLHHDPVREALKQATDAMFQHGNKQE
ncbi:MAG: tyrosine-type recombinase/integrase [Flavobacterium sp.]|nr:tyrosine-type recombinase/integrase [Flavobacterium sp.]